MLKFISKIKIFVYLFGLVIVFFSPACKAPAKVSQAAAEKEPVSGDSLFAAIERSPCFGKCRTYSISVYKSGYVVYEGKQWVENIGLFYTFITPGKMAEISAFAEKIGFAEMNDSYRDPNIMDVPSTYTSYRVNGKIKRIDNTFGNPPAGLIEFEKYLDDLFSDTKWIKIKSNNKD